MAGKAKRSGESRVHSVRWTAEEWKGIEAKAKQLADSVRPQFPMKIEPVDVIRMAVRTFIDGEDK